MISTMSVLYAPPAQRQLTDLPVELLAEIYLVALSPHLAHTCKYIYTCIKSFPSSVHAQYILGKVLFPLTGAQTNSKLVLSSVITRALRYPLCTAPVMDAMLRITPHSKQIDPPLSPFELPKRLFRGLDDSGPDADPLPFLRFLWDNACLPPPSPNSHTGYPLVRAVDAGFRPLVEFLLSRGADPRQRSCMAVRVAIGRCNLELVRMLIERPPEGVGGKKRRREDRVTVEPSMVDLAVRCDARDIVRYLVQEKGCVPSMKTLKAM